MIARPRLVKAVIGVPAVPPGRAAAAASSVRAWLGRARDALAPPPLRVMDAALSWLDHVTVQALCAVGVPDALDRRMALDELRARLDVDCDSLVRLLRFAEARGWVRFDRRQRIRPTRALAFLAEAHPGGWRAWIEFTARPEVTAAGYALGEAVANGAPAFKLANGSTFFSWMREHPEASAVFDAAMAAGARLHAIGLAKALRWDSTRTVCDVGGGNGALLLTLTDLHPRLRGIVLDLPHVVRGLRSTDRVEFVAGDTFDHVPRGQDRYLLVNVIHDWSDADALRVLTVVSAAATSSDADVVVVEARRRARPLDDLAARADMLMLALAPGGRERTSAELDDLARSAGLRPVGAVRLPSADTAHIYSSSKPGSAGK